MDNDITINLNTLRERMQSAGGASLMAKKDTQLVAVSKGQSFEKITDALKAGQRIFGENRIHEAQEKWPALRKDYPDITLHLIGPLQSNKVKEAVALFDVIQTLDRPKLADALSSQLEGTSRRIACFIQVNTGEEPQKSGIMPRDLGEFLAYCQNKHALDIVGLMCIPPQDESAALHFGLLQKLALRYGLSKLSMGMSGDFETGIRFGATHIRVGTALFGERGYA